VLDKEELTLILQYNSAEAMASNSAEAKTASNQPTITHGTYKATWWWALAAEILNYKYILDIAINAAATTFLSRHYKLCLLYDSAGHVYETPEVGYYGNYYKKIAAVASLGLSRQSQNASFGPYYYFSTFIHALRNAVRTITSQPFKIGDTFITVDDKGRYEKGGLVRFALFVGKTKMLMGRPVDPVDDSPISQRLAAEREFVKAMLKLRDSGAKWTTDYNSVRIGSHAIKLPDKPVIITQPMVALKTYEQQVPLEYYYVDTSQVREDVANAIIL
jgi:hypothetical protein